MDRHCVAGTLVVLLLGVCDAGAAGGSITGLVVAERERSPGERSLLVGVQVTDAARPDELRIGLGRRLARSVTAALLPAGWRSAVRGGDLVASGPAATPPLYLRLDAGAGDLPAKIDVTVLAGGERIAKVRSVTVASAPPPRTITDRAEAAAALVLPPAVAPGDTVVVGIADLTRLPAGGRWWIAGPAGASEEGDGGARSTFPAGWPQRQAPYSATVAVPGRVTTGQELRLTYTDPWGERLVAADIAPLLTLVPAAAAGGARVTGSNRFAFTDQALCICGAFPTSAARHGLLLDGSTPLTVVAASSSVVLATLPAGTTPGAHTVSGDPAAGYGASDSTGFAALAVRGSIDQEKLRLLQSTPMRLAVEGTAEPLPVRLSNATPKVIALEGGVEQVAATSGGPDNALTRTVTGVHTGAFDIRYELSGDPCPCLEGAFRTTTAVGSGGKPVATPLAGPGATCPRPGATLADTTPELRWPAAEPGATYSLALWALDTGTTLADATAAPPYFLAAGLAEPRLDYPASGPPLMPGGSYAWRVDTGISGSVLPGTPLLFNLAPADPAAELRELLEHLRTVEEEWQQAIDDLESNPMVEEVRLYQAIGAVVANLDGLDDSTLVALKDFLACNDAPMGKLPEASFSAGLKVLEGLIRLAAQADDLSRAQRRTLRSLAGWVADAREAGSERLAAVKQRIDLAWDPLAHLKEAIEDGIRGAVEDAAKRALAKVVGAKAAGPIMAIINDLANAADFFSEYSTIEERRCMWNRLMIEAVKRAAVLDAFHMDPEWTTGSPTIWCVGPQCQGATLMLEPKLKCFKRKQGGEACEGEWCTHDLAFTDGSGTAKEIAVADMKRVEAGDGRCPTVRYETKVEVKLPAQRCGGPCYMVMVIHNLLTGEETHHLLGAL